jgi:hypothetical protein
MKFMFGAIEKMSARTAFDIDHIPNGGKGLAWIGDLEASPEVFEDLKVGEVSRAKHAVKLGSRPLPSLGCKGFWNGMGGEEWDLVRSLETWIGGGWDSWVCHGGLLLSHGHAASIDG